MSSRFITYATFFILNNLSLEKTPLNLDSYLKNLVISMLLKGWFKNKHYIHVIIISSSYSHDLPSSNTFTTEEITGCTNEAAEGANKAAINPSFFFISCFTASVTSSIMNVLKTSQF